MNEEIMAALNKRISDAGGYIDFSGKNCGDYEDENWTGCAGWDGEERRCQCGNRRVNWECDGDENDPASYYAQAW